MSTAQAKEIKQPKVFISYSWTSPEHEDWVLDLANSMHEDGIHVILDKWDLRPGQDSFDFMEQMVKDPSISKIIMVIDSKYTEKANSREGGVGTESTILSKELYTEKDKNNILAVIAEPGAQKPVFYAGRLHIDLSNSETYTENYESLIRWAYDRYKYERPKALGSAPSFITADETSVALYTNTEFRIALDAIEKGRSNASGTIKSYLNKLNLELSKLYIEKSESNSLELFKKNVINFQSHLLEFKKIVDSVCHHSTDSKIHKHIRHFLEELLNHLTIIPNGGSRYNVDLELFEFINYQYFLNYVAILLKNEEFSEIKELLDDLFIIPNYFYQRHISTKHHNFCIFKPYEARIINNEIMKNKISPLGAMLKEYQDGEIVSFNHIIEADIFLYIKSIAILAKETKTNVWWPHTALYLGFSGNNDALKVFLKSEKPSYFSEVKNVLSVENLLFIEKICPHEDDWSNHFIPKWRDSGLILNVKALTNFKKLQPSRRSTVEII